MYLLDSNICIALMHNNRDVVSTFNRYFPQCYLSRIVVAELYKGVHLSQRTEDNLPSLLRLTELINIRPFDTPDAEEFGKIQAELRALGRPTGAMDALIAAVARSNDDILVTHNTRNFQNIPNLRLEDWL